MKQKRTNLMLGMICLDEIDSADLSDWPDEWLLDLQQLAAKVAISTKREWWRRLGGNTKDKTNGTYIPQT